MNIEETYARVAQAIDDGCVAHSYLLTGDLRGDALEFTYRLLEKIFGVDGVRTRVHPDIHWIVPEKTSRIISVEAMRERLLDQMAQTSFKGGWKAGVIMGADRLNQSSGNAFLKVLEEPTPKTIFLLLTDSPEQILPTIASRCQRLTLGRPSARRLSQGKHGEVMTILSQQNQGGITAKAAAMTRLMAILDALHEQAEVEVSNERLSVKGGPGEEMTKDQYNTLVSARYRGYRTDFALSLMSWFRDLAAVRCVGGDVPLQNPSYRKLLVAHAAHLTRLQALRNVDAVERVVQSFIRNMKEEPVLFAFADAVDFGTETP